MRTLFATFAAAVALALGIGVIAAPAADAAPKFCDRHGNGVYIHACATGNGGGKDVLPLAEEDDDKDEGKHKHRHHHHKRHHGKKHGHKHGHGHGHHGGHHGGGSDNNDES